LEEQHPRLLPLDHHYSLAGSWEVEGRNQPILDFGRLRALAISSTLIRCRTAHFILTPDPPNPSRNVRYARDLRYVYNRIGRLSMRAVANLSPSAFPTAAGESWQDHRRARAAPGALSSQGPARRPSQGRTRGYRGAGARRA